MKNFTNNKLIGTLKVYDLNPLCSRYIEIPVSLIEEISSNLHCNYYSPNLSFLENIHTNGAFELLLFNKALKRGYDPVLSTEDSLLQNMFKDLLVLHCDQIEI